MTSYTFKIRGFLFFLLIGYQVSAQQKPAMPDAEPIVQLMLQGKIEAAIQQIETDSEAAPPKARRRYAIVVWGQLLKSYFFENNKFNAQNIELIAIANSLKTKDEQIDFGMGLSSFCMQAVGNGERITVKQFRFIRSEVTAVLDQTQVKNQPELLAMLYLSRATLGFIPDPSYQSQSEDFDQAVTLADESFLENQDSRAFIYFPYINYQYGVQKDFEKAEKYLHKVKELSDQELSADVRLVNLWREKGDKERAMEKSLQLLLNDKLSLQNRTEINIELADLYTQKGNFEKATIYFKNAKELIDEMAQDPQLGGFQNYFVGNYNSKYLPFQYKNGNPPEITKEDLEWGVKQQHNQFLYLEAAIEILRSREEYEKIAFLEKLLEKRRELGMFQTLSANSKVVNALGKVYTQKGDYAKAANYYQRAFELLSSKAAGQEIQLEAIKDPASGLAIFKAQLQNQLKWRQAQPDTVGLEAIYQTAQQAITLLDRMRTELTTRGAKELLLNDAPWMYDQAVKVSLELYEQTQDESYLKDAFAFTEKNKAVLLLDALKENDARRFGNLPKEMMQQERSLEADINYYRAERMSAEQRNDSLRVNRYSQYLVEKREALDALKSKLEKDYPKYFQLKYQSEIANSEQLQEALFKRGMTLVVYKISPEHVYISIINKEGLRVKTVALPAEFEQNLKTYIQTLTQIGVSKAQPEKSVKTLKEKGYFLYQHLLEPCFKKLPDRLLIVPDGLLAYLPFESLPISEAGEGRDFGSLEYLIQETAISYAYSATLWLENLAQQAAPTRPGLLALAPNYTPNQNGKQRGDRNWELIRDRLPQLQGAVEEVKWLQQHYSGQFLFDKDATESNFIEQAGNYSVLHLAMHGVVDEDNPAYSGLFFTNVKDTSSDNILLAYEIPQLELNAELVVLSACQTGFGRYQNGEGVMSLGRSFMYAGVPALVMTLWEVNDQTAQLLMQRFYQYLAEGQPKDLALQQAKKDFLQTSDPLAAHPYFWSGYVLVGDAAPVERLKEGAFSWLWVGLGAGLLLMILLVFVFRKSKK